MKPDSTPSRPVAPGEVVHLAIDRTPERSRLSATVGGCAASVVDASIPGAVGVLIPSGVAGEAEVVIRDRSHAIARRMVEVGPPPCIRFVCRLQGGRVSLLSSAPTAGFCGPARGAPPGSRALAIVVGDREGRIFHRETLPFPGDEGVEVFDFRKNGAPFRVPQGDGIIFSFKLPNLGRPLILRFLEFRPDALESEGKDMGEVELAT